MNVRCDPRPVIRPRSLPLPRLNYGFSLIELMITLAIIAVLVAIALPSYARYVLRSNRSDAERLMTTIANRESQYLLDARAYTDTIGAGGLNVTALDGWTCEATCTNGHYTVAVEVDGAAFSVTATPLGEQEPDGTLLLTSDGTRSRTVGDVDHGW